jgi:nicotinate-nucleotide adenylyltransferase
MKEIGLFCGTFNPIHLGHLLIAECARDQFALEKVLFVTSTMPPHRSGGLLPGIDRFAMVQAAVATNPLFEASTLELDRPGPSYTVDTVKQVLADHNNQVRVNLIIGGDNMPFLKEWHNAAELISLCRLLVVPRLRYVGEAENSGQNSSQNSGPNSGPNNKNSVIKTLTQAQADSYDDCQLEGAQVCIVDFPGIAISASTIRKRVAAGQSVLYMVPPEVDKIIAAKKYFLKTNPIILPVNL